MVHPVLYKPKEGQEILMSVLDFCPEGYVIGSFKDGEYQTELSGVITEYVIEWIPLTEIEKLFN